MILRVGDDLAFALTGFPAALAAPVADFFRRFLDPAATPTGGEIAVRVVDQTLVPAAPDAPPLLREPPLDVHRCAGGLLLVLPGVRCLCDEAAGEARVALDDTGRAAPAHLAPWLLVAALFVLARPRGWLGVHAAAVEVAGRAVLLPGASGCGKSTLHRQARELGLGVLSDDLVWLRHHDAAVTRVVAFPRGGAGAGDPAPTVDDLPLGAVVFPSIVGAGPSRLTQLEAAEVVRALMAPTSFFATAAGAREHFRMLASLSRSVPCLALLAGPGADAVPVLRDGLTARFAGAPRRA